MKKKSKRCKVTKECDTVLKLEIDTVKSPGTHFILGPKKAIMKIYNQIDPLNSPMKPYRKHRNGCTNLKPYVDWYDNKIGILKR
jgi:hypothetical protein